MFNVMYFYVVLFYFILCTNEPDRAPLAAVGTENTARECLLEAVETEIRPGRTADPRILNHAGNFKSTLQQSVSEPSPLCTRSPSPAVFMSSPLYSGFDVTKQTTIMSPLYWPNSTVSVQLGLAGRCSPTLVLAGKSGEPIKMSIREKRIDVKSPQQPGGKLWGWATHASRTCENR
jgi:hypothetical protein